MSSADTTSPLGVGFGCLVAGSTGHLIAGSTGYVIAGSIGCLVIL